MGKGKYERKEATSWHCRLKALRKKTDEGRKKSRSFSYSPLTIKKGRK